MADEIEDLAKKARRIWGQIEREQKKRPPDNGKLQRLEAEYDRTNNKIAELVRKNKEKM